jgi:hypothetical protein
MEYRETGRTDLFVFLNGAKKHNALSLLLSSLDFQIRVNGAIAKLAKEKAKGGVVNTRPPGRCSMLAFEMYYFPRLCY